MEHQERYQGQLIFITTSQQVDGWTAKAELLEADSRRSVPQDNVETTYASEQEAKSAALSAAAGAIDRGRTARGKP